MDLANERPMRLALEALHPKQGEIILDAGCGPGTALRALSRTTDCRLFGLDHSEAMIAEAKRRLRERAVLETGEIEHLPRSWPPFDAILAMNVLYFAQDDGLMVAALRRALRRGGRLVAYVTDRQTMERWAFASAGYHRLFDRHDLEYLLVQGGFGRASISIKDYALAPSIRGLIAHAER